MDNKLSQVFHQKKLNKQSIQTLLKVYFAFLIWTWLFLIKFLQVMSMLMI